MDNLAKAGIGCGCLPAALLTLASAACFVLVAVGAVNYSEEDTVMITGAMLGAGAILFSVPGAILIIAASMQAKNSRR